MKRIGIGSTALMLLLFGATYSFAQDKPDQHDEDKKASHQEQPAKQAPPAQHEEKAQPAQHEEKAPTAEVAKRSEPAETTEHTDRTAKTEQSKPEKQHSESATSTQETHGAQRSEQSYNFGGHGGGHIEDVRFRASFGSSHHFHMDRPVIYEGYSRFDYGGYYFGFYDPWPTDWGYSDDVYVDYIDGQYYLIDPEHSGPRLMINVVL
jgi:hypothetical protein